MRSVIGQGEHQGSAGQVREQADYPDLVVGEVRAAAGGRAWLGHPRLRDELGGDAATSGRESWASLMSVKNTLSCWQSRSLNRSCVPM